MRISDWSSDVCSSDLVIAGQTDVRPAHRRKVRKQCRIERRADSVEVLGGPVEIDRVPVGNRRNQQVQPRCAKFLIFQRAIGEPTLPVGRSEEHTSELQSLMRISYAVFCLKKKTK